MSRYENQKSYIQKIKQTIDGHAFTGLVSESLGIGTEADKLNSFNDYSFRQILPTTARRLYANSDVLQNIIDVPALDATREWITLTSDYDDEGASTMIMKRLEELGVQDHLRRHLENIGLYSRGSLFLPVIKETMEMDASERLSINAIQRVEDINVLDEDDFTIHMNLTNPFDKNYLRPQFAQIQGSTVHQSRYIWNVYKFFSRENQGISQLQKILLATLALRVTNWSLASVMLEVQNKVLKINDFDAYGNQDSAMPDFKSSSTNKFTSAVNSVKTWLTSQKLIVLNKDDEYDRQMYSATGVKESTDFFWEYLSAVTGYPQATIKGQAMGTISSADTDARRYVEKIRAQAQFKIMKPILEFLIRILKNEQNSPFYRKWGINGDAINFNIEFNPIWQPDANEQSNINLRDSQRGQVDISMGVRAPDQVRRELYPDLEDEPLPELPEQDIDQVLKNQSLQQELFR